MARYLLLYRTNPDASMPEPTPEQIEEINAAWNSWAERAGKGIVDFGAPTAPHSADADRWVGGYSIVEFDSEDDLNASLASHPHKAMGGTIDVFEVQPVPGM